MQRSQTIERCKAPIDEIEENLADIWRELLSIDHISRHDNFFALGGDSSSVVQLLAKLKEIELYITMQDVFDSPTLSTLALKLARYKAVAIPPNLIMKNSSEITPEMLPLITLSQADIDTVVTQIPGGVANIQDIYGLTPLQNGMLYHQLMTKEGDPYLLASRLRFIDWASLQRYANSIQQTIKRHDILRTAIFWDGLSEPAQVVLRQVPSLLSKITLNEFNKSVVQQLTQDFSPNHYRLDLTKAPLLRLIAAPESEGRWGAVQLMPHMIIDHFTLERLQAEIHTIMNGKIDTLKALTPFRHFVAQYRLRISSAEHTRFFTEMLGDIDEPTLPFGLSVIDKFGAEINESYMKLSQSLYDQLHEHARNSHVSLASICHLAWAQVIAKASGRDSVVFGTVIQGSLQAGERNVIVMGPTNNTLPIRLNIDERSIETTVRDTHARLSELLVHEHAPIVLAQRCSGVPVGLPLFSALINYRHNQKAGEMNTILPEIKFLDIAGQTTYSLTMSVDDIDSSLCLSAHVMLPMSANRICAYMQQALESLADALSHTPQLAVQKLTVTPLKERNLLLHNWNQTPVTHSTVCCLHQLFEAQVQFDGQAIAVEYEGLILSYAELNSQANKLANFLIAQGVKPDDCIAFCVESSTAMIVAMMGILKSGCAFVALDPVYSSQRLTDVLLDANPIFLLADSTGQNALGEHRVSVIDLEKQFPYDMPIDNPDITEIGLTSAHLAYIIYTSGSTGTPKGVIAEHQQFINIFSATNEKFGFTKQDKWCLFHSISFAISLLEIWNALYYGGQLWIVPHNIIRSTVDFYNWACVNGITVLNQTPSAFKMLIRTKNSCSESDRLRYIILAGEALDPFVTKEWYEKYGKSGTKLVNMYGNSETFHATCYRLEPSRNINSIGRPLPDLSVYLLDSNGWPLLLGAEGEIYISGPRVARGYLNRPGLTTERFLPDPFNQIPTTRMYRTGDLARYLPDGNLVFLGRADQQVKIRGFRIELGEIQARLVEHPQVSEAAVQPYGNGTDARLVAYVVTGANTSLTKSLRPYLLKLLPDYMVPAAYVYLSSLPKTPSGKLDRRALPAPDDEAFARQQYEAPQGEMEEKLADVWRELLCVDRISRYDNFFALGGQSLLAIRLLEQLKHIGLDTTVREVFRAPNLVILASTLTHYKTVTVPSNLIMEDSTEITPEMLPLITLSQADIDMIIAQIPGGVANIQDIYGLTPLQNGMLYHHLMAKEGDPYLILSRMSFIDRTTLEWYVDAVQQTIKRHDILRTALIWDGLSEPAQIVLHQVSSFLTEITLDKFDKPALEQLNQGFNTHGYRLDLTKAPLLRLIAAPESEGNWVAMQLMHHSITDHSSLEKMQAEIHVIMDGKSEALSTPTPFRHFVAQVRLGTNSAEHLQFFTEMLNDIDEPILPFGVSDVHQEGSEINKAYLELTQSLNDQLRLHARNFQVGLASICHLTWAQVLAKASGRESVVFGTVLLGRLQTEVGNSTIIGPMINTLPMRLNIDERSVDTVVRDTHDRLSALLAHEHAPLVLAQRCSGVAMGSQIFSALMNYRHNQKIEVAKSLLPGVTLLDSVGQTNYPLTLSVDDNDCSLNLFVQVVSPISSTRICAYTQQSLESLVDALTPHHPIRKLRAMPPCERTLLLHGWNQIIVTHSPVRCLHQLVEAHVEFDGHAIAVEYQGHTLSYSELNIQANSLAHYLIAQGTKPDDRIALCLERSIAMIVGILGILKAGCAYVPLDSVYASQRLTNILLDADPVFLLVDSSGHNALGDHQVPVIDLKKPLFTNSSTDNPETIKLGLTPAHLAYIIYTSGSTGTPKGVMVAHQQVVRLFEATRDKFDFDNQDRWCVFHSISFDFSVWEIWGSLWNGSRLSIVSCKIIHCTDEFCDWICTSGITVLNQTPSAFKMLMQVENLSSRCDLMRYIILAGEWLDPLIAKNWYEKLANNETLLINMYGPTETTVYTTIQKIETVEDIYSIGRPLPGVTVYLLDSYGEPMIVGAEGEIHISGPMVTRGYLNRPGLTTERFLPDPFNDDPTARMYRTGDLARYLPDGNLVFLGRIDQQVKIRGFRIELGEIEARLVEHPDVHDAVVQLYGDGPDTRLIAYVAAVSDQTLAQNLRTYLLTLLPVYMVPAAYVCLPSLPLTPSGKLDRRSLPAPDDEAFARQQYEAPQGELEEKLTDIWRELLSVDRISRYDNFFTLGGHSLLVVQMLARLRQIRLDTTAREVFEARTLATLASKLITYIVVTVPPNSITEYSTEITPEMLPLINLSQADIHKIVAQIPGGVSNIQDIYGLTSFQNGILYHHLMVKEGDSYLTVSRLSFIDRILLERYADAMQKVIERHDILRTAIFWDGLSEPAQVVLRRVPSSLTKIISDISNVPVLEQLTQEFHPHRYRLDLTEAPLLRLIAAPESEGNWVALQLMHHSIIDHLSLERLLTEIHAMMNGKSDVLLTTPTPYRIFVAQSRLGMSSAEHTRFFTEMLGDIDKPTLPFGLSDVFQVGSEINEAYLEVSKTQNDQLRAQARNLQVSLASICHMAWAQVLAKASGCESVVFGTVLLGRLQSGEGNNTIIGPMINTLPIRLNIDERSVDISVRDSHAGLSALLAHEHAPLVLAQRCSGIPSGLPLFSSLLNYRHNQNTGEVYTPPSGVNVIDIEERTNYPIALSVEDNISSLGLTVQVALPSFATRLCEYMQQSLESLLEAITHTPHQPIRELRIMPPDERTLLLHSWNQTTVTYSPFYCLHQLFEAQVECDGGAIAVECDGHSLTYAELNIQANRLAHYMITQGVKPDDRIALCVERSSAMIVGILGILKAGCAYLPLDPVYASQRLTNILLDADPIFILADYIGRNALGNHQVPVIELEKPLPTNSSTDNPVAINLRLTPAHLAYIIYTSGSTGTPKGVMVEHQQVVRLFEATRNEFDFNKQDRWCLFHSVSFDFSLWEIWGSLLKGSQLSIASYRIIHYTNEFCDWICTSGITVLNQTPSAFKILIDLHSFSRDTFFSVYGRFL